MCVYVCVCAYAYLCVHAYMLTHLWKPEVSTGVFQYCSPPYFMRQGLLLILEFTDSARPPCQQASEIFPSAGITNVDHHVGLFTWMLGNRAHRLVLFYLLSHLHSPCVIILNNVGKTDLAQSNAFWCSALIRGILGCSVN